MARATQPSTISTPSADGGAPCAPKGVPPAPSAVFDAPSFAGHEEVLFAHDAASGLKAIIAIHDTRLGPAIGGCRMWPYDNPAAALTDVLRLSRAMSYKQAIAEIPHGGGKSVIIGNPRSDKTPALMRAFGRMVERAGGRYLVAEDVGTTVEDMSLVREETAHVLGTPEATGGSGDPSPVTAYGVFMGLRAAVKYQLARDSLEGVIIAVQGLGHVGQALCDLLHEAGATLVVADIDADRVLDAARRCAATATAPDAIYSADADVFAPCALGGTLNGSTIPRLKAKVIAGAANNQLATDEDADALAARGILYAPDYVINAGGIINVSCERQGYDRDRAMGETAKIYDTAMAIFNRAAEEKRSTAAVADAMAEERLAQA